MIRFFRPDKKLIRLCLPVLSIVYLPFVSAVEIEGNAQKIKFKQLPDEFAFVRVTGPEGYVQESSKGVVGSLTKEPMNDGVYKFQLFVNSDYKPTKELYKSGLNNGRSSDVRPSKKAIKVTEAGSFRLSNKQLVILKDGKE